MAEIKTQKNNKSVARFLKTIENEEQQKYCRAIIDLMQKITKSEPVMWGESIIGFGDYHYKYASGREGDWFICGLSPRKANISIYFCLCDLSTMSSDLKKLGRHKTGKSCLYIKRLGDIDIKILEKMLKDNMKRYA